MKFTHPLILISVFPVRPSNTARGSIRNKCWVGLVRVLSSNCNCTCIQAQAQIWLTPCHRSHDILVIKTLQCETINLWFACLLKFESDSKHDSTLPPDALLSDATASLVTPCQAPRCNSKWLIKQNRTSDWISCASVSHAIALPLTAWAIMIIQMTRWLWGLAHGFLLLSLILLCHGKAQTAAAATRKTLKQDLF